RFFRSQHEIVAMSPHCGRFRSPMPIHPQSRTTRLPLLDKADLYPHVQPYREPPPLLGRAGTLQGRDPCRPRSIMNTSSSATIRVGAVRHLAVDWKGRRPSAEGFGPTALSARRRLGGGLKNGKTVEKPAERSVA